MTILSQKNKPCFNRVVGVKPDSGSYKLCRQKPLLFATGRDEKCSLQSTVEQAALFYWLTLSTALFYWSTSMALFMIKIIMGHEKCRRCRSLHFSRSPSTRLHFSTGRRQPNRSFLPVQWSTLVGAVDVHFYCTFHHALATCVLFKIKSWCISFKFDCNQCKSNFSLERRESL